MSAPPLIAARYRLVETIGLGGMGEVFRARDERYARNVAVKLMAEHLAADELAVRRFTREAEITRRLRHPAIVAGLDGGFDEESGRHYIVMELVEGDDAGALAGPDGRVSLADVVGVVGQICDALTYAHQHRVVHGDVSIANILVRHADRAAKLADFGLARTCRGGGVPARTRPAGTPRFLAPEVADGWEATPLSDLYSLGAVAHRLLAGEQPHHSDTSSTLRLGAAAAQPPALDELGADVPITVARAIGKALETDPRNRYSSVADFRDELVGLRLARAA